MSLSLKNINYSILGKKVIDDLSLDFKVGEINVVYSASGKTTLSKIISGYTSKHEGTVYNNFKTGVVFENPEDMFFSKSVYLELIYGYKGTDLKMRVDDTLKIIGLDKSFLERDPSTLSAGESRKLGIGIVLMSNPSLIIFDEVLTGLDYDNRLDLIKFIKMVNSKYNKTIIMITKDPELVLSVANNVFMLGDGKLVYEGSKYSLFRDYKLCHKYSLGIPKMYEFINKLEAAKKIKLPDRDDILDLMKDVYRLV